MGFVTRFLNGASQEIKVKLNESRRLKFYQVKQLKENSTKISAARKFKEDSQFKELWKMIAATEVTFHILHVVERDTGISTFVGYLTPNPFLCKSSALFQTIQFSMSTQFGCQKCF